MPGERREEVRPCFCGTGRITEIWYDGHWSEIVLQCAGCDRIYEYRVVERVADGSEKTAWVKREVELLPESTEGRTNPLFSDHDYNGQPFMPHLSGLTGPHFAKDSAGQGFSQPELADLRHFDSIGSF